MEKFTPETMVQNFENAVVKVVNDLKFGKNGELKIVSCGHDLENVELNIANHILQAKFEANHILQSCINFLPSGMLHSTKYIAKEMGIFKTLETLDF